MDRMNRSNLTQTRNVYRGDRQTAHTGRSRCKREKQYGQTALFACKSVPDAIKPLVPAGADIEARDQHGDTALIHEAFVEAMVRELLANGADPTAVATNGNTALKRAGESSCKHCVDLIEAALKKKNSMPRN
jgi:ankyrin repeat protein